MAEAIGEVLGGSEDGYSLIFKGRMDDNRVVAIKRVITGTTDINEVNKLIELSTNKQHENIIRYYQLKECNPYTYIYLELCSGNLYDFVEKKSFDCSGLDRKTAVKQIALGLEHIHRNGIYHLDLKPSNILVTDTCPKRLVLADFEVSKQVHDRKESIRTKTFGGTIGWIAPEIEYFYEFEMRITRKADIFSFGLLVYYIWTRGSHPFIDRPRLAHDMLQEAQQRIKAYGTESNASLELNMIDDSIQDGVLVKNLLCYLLERHPECRPDARDVVKHPFFWNQHYQCEFYKQVGDCIESLHSIINQKELNASQRLRARLDQGKDKVIHGNWYNRLHPIIERHYTYYQKPVNKLITRTEQTSEFVKIIRNYFVHYVSNTLKSLDVGSLPSHDASEDQAPSCIDSFTKNLPQLLLHTYHAAVPWRDDVKLREFYPECDFPSFQELQEDDKGIAFESNDSSLQIEVRSKLVVPEMELGIKPRLSDLCMSGEDEFIVADENNNVLIRMRKNGEYIGTVVTSESLKSPVNVAYGQKGEIIISQPLADRVTILDRTSGESIILEANGKKFKKPHGIAINSEGKIFVCDSENKRIVTLNGDEQFEIGETGSGKNEMEQCFKAAFDKQDNIFVTDRTTNKIHMFSKDGNFVRCIGPQLSKWHRITECSGIAIYEKYIAISDFYEDKVHVLTTAGEHICCVDGFNHPSGIVHDQNGIFYVCDSHNSQVVKLELCLKPMVSPMASTHTTGSDVSWKRKPQENIDVSE